MISPRNPRAELLAFHLRPMNLALTTYNDGTCYPNMASLSITIMAKLLSLRRAPRTLWVGTWCRSRAADGMNNSPSSPMCYSQTLCRILLRWPQAEFLWLATV